MAKYRALQTSFWDDAFVVDLTPEEKYFFIYILTNSKSAQCGCYELPYRVMEMQTGYNRETVEKLLKRFEDYGKIKYDRDTKEILIMNWHKHNYTKSIKVEACIIKEVSNIKSDEFRNILIEICKKYGYNTEDIPYTYPIDTVSIDYGEKEKQKQKQKETKKEKEKQKQSVRIDDDVEQETDVSKVLYEYLTNISLGDIEDINKALAAKNRDVNYLREKLEIMQHIRDIKYPVKYLLKAIEDDYRSYGKSEVKGSSSRNKFKNFYEPVAECTKEELEEKVRQSQNKKFG